MSVQQFVRLRDKLATNFSKTPIAAWSIKDFLESTKDYDKRLRLAAILRGWQLREGDLSDRATAPYFNTSGTSLSNWLRGVSFPTRESLKEVASTLGLAFSTFEMLLGELPPEKEEVDQSSYNDAVRTFLNLPKEVFLNAAPLVFDRILSYAGEGGAEQVSIAPTTAVPKATPQTVAELLIMSGKSIGVIEDESLLPRERVEAIVRGELIRKAEIGQLADALGADVSELTELAKNQNRMASELSDQQSPQSVMNLDALMGHNTHSQSFGLKNMRGSIGHLIQHVFRQKGLSIEQDFDQLAQFSTTQDPARLQRFKLIALGEIDPDLAELPMISAALSKFTQDFASFTLQRLLEVLENGHHPENENAPNHG